MHAEPLRSVRPVAQNGQALALERTFRIWIFSGHLGEGEKGAFQLQEK